MCCEHGSTRTPPRSRHRSSISCESTYRPVSLKSPVSQLVSKHACGVPAAAVLVTAVAVPLNCSGCRAGGAEQVELAGIPVDLGCSSTVHPGWGSISRTLTRAGLIARNDFAGVSPDGGSTEHMGPRRRDQRADGARPTAAAWSRRARRSDPGRQLTPGRCGPAWLAGKECRTCGNVARIPGLAR